MHTPPQASWEGALIKWLNKNSCKGDQSQNSWKITHSLLPLWLQTADFALLQLFWRWLIQLSHLVSHPTFSSWLLLSEAWLTHQYLRSAKVRNHKSKLVQPVQVCHFITVLWINLNKKKPSLFLKVQVLWRSILALIMQLTPMLLFVNKLCYM